MGQTRLDLYTSYEAYGSLDIPPADASIWRYVNLEKLLSMLQSRQLFFVSLDRFDDPYEGHYPEEVWQSIKPVFAVLAKSIRLSEKNVRRISRKQCYVNCWHVNQHDSAAMWSLYAGRAGVAIKSTYERLSTCLSTVREQLTIGLVRYVDHASVTRVEVGRTPAWYLKRKSFEHERELRAAIIRNISEATSGIPIPVDLDSLIEEIVVEPRAEEWVTGVVSDVVRRYGFTFKVRRSNLYTLG